MNRRFATLAATLLLPLALLLMLAAPTQLFDTAPVRPDAEPAAATQTVLPATEPPETTVTPETTPATAPTPSTQEPSQPPETEPPMTEPPATEPASETTTPPDTRACVTVPILMYHHFAEEGNDSTVITPENFRAQLEAAQAAGWQAVSMLELYDYVYYGCALPEKPFCITIDDGYLSNYTLAYPILQELNMKATIFCIGSSFGASTYKDTQTPITPHFDFAQAQEMMDSGLISIQCHTYDMHQWAAQEPEGQARTVMAPLAGETSEAFAAAIVQDIERYREMYKGALDGSLYVLAYPGGVFSEQTERVLHENGFPITLSTKASKRNQLVRGQPETLYALGRLNVTEAQSPQDILNYLSK